MKAGLVFWFTGLSGAGKTTVAVAARNKLEMQGLKTLILDGDDIRAHLHRHLGFSPEDIRENNSLIVGLCKKFRKDYDVILVPVISPFESGRRDAHRDLEPGFYLIYFDADLADLMQRDVKGLYGRARKGQLKNMVGYSPEVPFERPGNPDLVLKTTDEREDESVGKLFQFILEKCTH